MSLVHSLKKYVAKGIRQLPAPLHRLPEEWKQSYLRSAVKSQYTDIQENTARDPKVFGIGLSKTGTTSLNSALKILGYKSAHWTLEGQRVLSWPEFFYLEAAVDTPCAVQFESLYYTFENSKFIYTVRDVDEWKRSIQNHFGMESPREFRELWKENEFWEGNHGWRWYNSVRWIQVHECLYARHDTWEDAYYEFDRRVRSFFSEKPDDRIIVMNIPEGDAWEPLCQHLGHSIPETSFPHAGKSSNHPEGISKVDQYKGT